MRRAVFLWCAVAAMAGASGCGRSGGPETVPVSGTVTLDGAPVADGTVLFKDVGGHDRTYAGKVVNGRFSFPSTVGQKQVEITALEADDPPPGAVGGNPGDPISEENPAVYTRELIPAQYNSESTLTADVTSQGPNEFTFDLKSRP